MAHTRSAGLAAVTRVADIVCVAAGRPHLIGLEHVRPGAVVVDFGTNPMADGSTAGDVDTEQVRQVAAAITPVPGGTGPTTVAVLAEHTMQAAELHRHAD
jgi:methylenetetrahydrofolate dehydrogenase (NADP+)/methenyltetrahydrofolate cyclohydrolase